MIVQLNAKYSGKIFPMNPNEEGKTHFLRFEIYDHTYQTARRVLEGSLKWDGCLDVMFIDSQSDHYSHFCDPIDLDELTDCIRWVWLQGAEHITEWDFSPGKTIHLGLGRIIGPCSITYCRGLGMVAVELADGCRVQVCGEHATMISKPWAGNPCERCKKPAEAVIIDNDEKVSLCRDCIRKTC